MAVCVGVACIAVTETPLDKSQMPKESAWQSIVNAFASIWHGIKSLPAVFAAYAFVYVCVNYGYTAYNGNKGQFFVLEVYGGTSEGADACGDICTDAQEAYSLGFGIPDGRADLLFNLVGYVFSWMIPFLVRKFGARWVIAFSCLPQALLMAMAW